jgi:hypothetical protein
MLAEVLPGVELNIWATHGVHTDEIVAAYNRS